MTRTLQDVVVLGCPKISERLRPHSRPGPHPGRPRPKFLTKGYLLNLETRFR